MLLGWISPGQNTRRRGFLHRRRECITNPTKSAGVVVAFFAVFSEVEASHFNFFART